MGLRVGRAYNGKFLSCASVCDSEGWLDAIKYWPTDFSLVSVLVEGRKNPLKAWIISGRWDGLHIKEKDKITHWKPLPTSEASIKKHQRRLGKNEGSRF